MQSDDTLPPKSAAARTQTCGPAGCLKPGNNTDVFPTIDNTTMGCGASNCGIPPQRYLDQGMPDITFQPYLQMVGGNGAAAADPDDVVMVPAPPAAGAYRFYEDTPFAPGDLKKGDAFTVDGYGNFKPRGWTMPDAYSGRYAAKGTGGEKDASDFEAWQRGTSFPSRRYPLGHLPIRDALLAQEAPRTTWKWVLGITLGVAALAGVGYAGWRYYKKGKKPASAPVSAV